MGGNKGVGEKETKHTSAVQIGWVDGPRAIVHVGDLMVMIVQLLRRQRNLLRRGIDAGHGPDSVREVAR